MPFFIRRFWLLARGILVDRDHPPLARLASIENPDEFVWAILPHAARSFSVSILLLPSKAARAAAVGYLYARMLDTYEDLSISWAEARVAMAAFAERFDTVPPGPAPLAPNPANPGPRDSVHLLLVDRYRLVDELFAKLSPVDQRRVADLVKDMASAMSHS